MMSVPLPLTLGVLLLVLLLIIPSLGCTIRIRGYRVGLVLSVLVVRVCHLGCRFMRGRRRSSGRLVYEGCGETR